MAVFYVHHHLYPDNPQVFLTDVKQIVTVASEGDHWWHIVLHTSGVDSEGDQLGPFWVNAYGDDIDSLDELISDKIEEICEQIDWTQSWYDTGYEEGVDHTPPQISWQYPTNGQTDVPIDTSVSVRLVDLLPSKGIDLSSITMKINDITVSPSVNGNKYDCVVSFRPPAEG